MDNSKIIQLLNTNDTHDIAMVLLATDRILKKQFVEHLIFIVLKEVFNPKQQDIGRFIHCHWCLSTVISTVNFNKYSNTYNKAGFCGEIIIFRLNTKQVEYNKLRGDLCNPEDCVKIMKMLENIAYSYIDWWYKYYIKKN